MICNHDMYRALCIVTMNVFGDLLSFDPLQLVIIVVLQYLSAVMTNDEGQLECELVLINKYIHV